MRIKILILVVCATLNSSAAYGADCDTELKPSDTFRELSSKLKCLSNRIKALESVKASSGGGANVPLLTQPMSERAKILQNNALAVELQKCSWTGKNNDLECGFQLSNLTREDKNVCFGDGSRLVTDQGTSFSKASGYEAAVGSVRGQASYRQVCDTITPISKVYAWIRFSNSTKISTSEVQFIRLDCGSGCVYEAYKIPIN